jgi:hypothetical protein
MPDTDKRKVTMRNFVTTVDEDGAPQVHTHEATDYVPPDILDAYVADAQTRWQSVTVSDETDAGPGGADGETVTPIHLEGRTAADFEKYGDASTPENALDEITGKLE